MKVSVFPPAGMFSRMFFFQMTAEGFFHSCTVSAMAPFDALPEGARLRLTIEEDVPGKSVPANNFLHHIFRLVAKTMNDAGYGDGRPWTMERCKELCKKSGLYTAVDLVLPTGEIVQVAKPTAELDKVETSETINRCIAYFADMGIHIPEPGTQTEIELT